MDSKRILIVDDDQNIREVVGEFLQEQGFQIFMAGNGTEGLELAEKHEPDLILLDVELPDMKGYDVCRKIREISALQHTPIIMLTAMTQEKDELAGFKAGADDYVPKPFKLGRLLARIQTAIGRNMRELDANALTHLPGNRVILDEIQERIHKGQIFAVLYFDLNNFKAFNDYYGFMRGDDAIKLTADVILECFSNRNGHKTFVGHVGGDDFVAIIDTDQVEPICEELIQQFDTRIRSLYSAEDLAQEGIVSVDRKGHQTHFPVMGVAIAVVTNRSRSFQHPGELALVAGELKKRAKSENKSSFVIDRRSLT